VLVILAAGLCLSLPAAAFGDEEGALKMRSLNPPVLLPDGREFTTWEAPNGPDFSRTYYVDQKSAAAADANPGTREKPLKTISRAAELVQPGQRVVVASGIYREHVRIPRGGTGPMRMISFEAAPGARPVIRGSEVFKEKWTRKKGMKNAWQAKLAPKYFRNYKPFAVDWRRKPVPEDNANYNPFALPNIVIDTDGAKRYYTKLKSTAPFCLVRGLVFQDGRRLVQVKTLRELAGGAGRYHVNRNQQILTIRAFDDADPNEETIEITTRVSGISGAKIELGFIRIRGFTVEHTAPSFPVPQVGAISSWRGHHWIIEDNVVRWSNGIGIDGGMQTFFGNLKRPHKDRISRHIIRRNTVTDCGICGICSAGRTVETLVEDNVLRRNAWHDAAALPELGGIKLHHNIRTLIHRNLVVDTFNGSGIWMDYGNEHSRCTRNVILRASPAKNPMKLGAIFIEASSVPNLIDSNVIWGTFGNGIYEHDGIHQIFANNFIGKSKFHAFCIQGGPVVRKSYGNYRLPAGAHKVRNNILADNGKLYRIKGPRDVVGDLTSGVTCTFDPDKLELNWSVKGKAPKCEKVEAIVRDFFGKPLGTIVVPGPFGLLPRKKTSIRLWPPGKRNDDAKGER
jgi:hypothetical protein